MKGLLPALGILTAVSSTAAIAAPGSSGSPVFSCSLGKKSVLVTAVGKTLLNQFGTLRGPEMSLVGDLFRDQGSSF